MSSEAKVPTTQDISITKDSVGLGITFDTRNASFEQALEEEAHWLGDMGIKQDDYSIEPLDMVAGISCEVEELEDIDPPKGLKETNSEASAEWANPLKEVVEASTSGSSNGDTRIPRDVEEPPPNFQTWESLTNITRTPNCTCKPCTTLFYDRMRYAAERTRGSDGIMPRTQSEANVHKSDTPAVNIDSDDEDFPLPELQFLHHHQCGPEETDIAKAYRTTAFNACDASLASNSSARVPPLAADVLRQFLAKCVATTQALQVNGASKAKVKEVERIMESVLKEQQELSCTGVIAL